jgi:hypothetical protein
MPAGELSKSPFQTRMYIIRITTQCTYCDIHLAGFSRINIIFDGESLSNLWQSNCDLPANPGNLYLKLIFLVFRFCHPPEKFKKIGVTIFEACETVSLIIHHRIRKTLPSAQLPLLPLLLLLLFLIPVLFRSTNFCSPLPRRRSSLPLPASSLRVFSFPGADFKGLSLLPGSWLLVVC